MQDGANDEFTAKKKKKKKNYKIHALVEQFTHNNEIMKKQNWKHQLKHLGKDYSEHSPQGDAFHG